MSDKYWVVEKTDTAIAGCVSGVKSQRTVDGPFDDWDAAFSCKQRYRRYGCTYYTVTESETKPESSKEDYEFVDASREFDDVPGW